MGNHFRILEVIVFDGMWKGGEGRMMTRGRTIAIAEDLREGREENGLW